RFNISSGEWHASATPARISTVLGTCVAVCLYDPVKQVGGMNHFMLPQATGEEGPLAARYGVHAMELLVNTLMELGADRAGLRAKVFGAAHVIRGMESGEAVARKNAHFVRTFLEREAIPVEAEFLGGNQALVVQFFTHTGKARVKPLSVIPQQLIERDRSGSSTMSAHEPVLFGAEQDVSS
ncbi:MAG TPA: chemotaxis protein CheD, partial [Polyangiaceae bacterium]|nr:chemotaxis protein CheD [Polyangiaceae bacterium]